MYKQPIPKVSIIVPVYKVEEYLPQCIDSLINQTYQNLEIILVDDGSPDNSGLICDEYAEKDSRIKVIHKENGGLSNARNIGTFKSTGDFIIYLDSDDWLDSETCEVAIDSALKNDADIVFWGYIKEYSGGLSKAVSLFMENSIFSGKSKLWLHRRLVGLVKNELSNPTKTDAINSAWGKLYRKNLILSKNISFRDTKEVGSEDVLFNIEVFYWAKRIVYINNTFNHYRQDNPNALTKNHNSTLFIRFLNLFKYIEEFINTNNLNDEYYTALSNRITLSIINNSLSITGKRNPDGFLKQISAIKGILQNKTYSVSAKQIDLVYLSLHWKVFFIFCKLKFALGVYLLTLVMRKLR